LLSPVWRCGTSWTRADAARKPALCHAILSKDDGVVNAADAHSHVENSYFRTAKEAHGFAAKTATSPFFTLK